MGRNRVLRNKRSGKVRVFFVGKDGKKPLLQKILLALIVLVLLIGAFLVYRDAAVFHRQQGGRFPTVSSYADL